MNTEQERRQFRKRLVDLTETELTQWMFLAGLCARIETELLAYHAVFAPDIALEPAPDTQITTVQYLLAGEIKRRSRATAKLQKLPIETEGEEQHANHAQANGSH
jgi:hypothetical protein